MTKFILTDVYDDTGDLIRIEARDSTGKFVVQAVWDPNDEQTSENREAFREWFYRILKQKEHQV